MADEATKATNQAGDPSEHVAFRVELTPAENSATHYANYAEVTRSAYEIGISFARLSAKLSPSDIACAKEIGVLTRETLVHLMLPPKVARGLISALQTQIDLFDENSDRERREPKSE